MRAVESCGRCEMYVYTRGTYILRRHVAILSLSLSASRCERCVLELRAACAGMRERCSRKNPIHRRRNEESERPRGRHRERERRRTRRRSEGCSSEGKRGAICIRRRRQVGERSLMKLKKFPWRGRLRAELRVDHRVVFSKSPLSCLRTALEFDLRMIDPWDCRLSTYPGELSKRTSNCGCCEKFGIDYVDKILIFNICYPDN